MFRIGFEAEFLYQPKRDLGDLARQLANEFGVSVETIHMFDRPNFSNGSWFVCYDSSIREIEQRQGMEIVSPPAQPIQTVEWLSRICEFIRTYGKTTPDCALHFTMSLDERRPDMRRIVRYADDAYWLERFGRNDNHYARPTASILMEDDHDFHQKPYSINCHGGAHLIEFKHCGSGRQPYESKAMWSVVMEYLGAEISAFLSGFEDE